MTPAPRLASYAGLAVLGAAGAVLLGRPELAALAAPAALLVAFGIARRPAAIEIDVTVDLRSAVEGDVVRVHVRLASPTPVERAEVLLAVPPGLTPISPDPVAVRILPGDPVDVVFEVRCDRWGLHHLGRVVVRATGGLGLVRHEREVPAACAVKVHPAAEVLRSMITPADTNPWAGNRVARQKGSGIEFADVRPFSPGDRVRSVNWRVTARLGQPYVNDQRIERTADVVLFLDTFNEARCDPDTTLGLAVRAAASLGASHLGAHDRVGLVTFGGVLEWLRPGFGPRQLHRVVDALLASRVYASEASKTVAAIPHRALPPAALVIGLTPLLDDRGVGALLDLRHRGFDVAVVDVFPLVALPPGTGEAEQLGRRLWQVHRESIRSRLAELGVPAVTWAEGVPFAAVIEEVRSYRRQRRVAPA